MQLDISIDCISWNLRQNNQCTISKAKQGQFQTLVLQLLPLNQFDDKAYQKRQPTANPSSWQWWQSGLWQTVEASWYDKQKLLWVPKRWTSLCVNGACGRKRQWWVRIFSRSACRLSGWKLDWVRFLLLCDIVVSSTTLKYLTSGIETNRNVSFRWFHYQANATAFTSEWQTDQRRTSGFVTVIKRVH